MKKRNVKYFVFIGVIIIILISLGIVSLIASVQYVLSYDWEKEENYNFIATCSDAIEIEDTTKSIVKQINAHTSANFSLIVDSVYDDGSADARISIQSFVVRRDDGNLIASIREIPEDLLTIDMHIDGEGNFMFYEIPYIIIDQELNLLVTNYIDEYSIAANSLSVKNDVTADVLAEFDSETGIIEPEFSLNDIERPKKQINIDISSIKIDILPLQILKLLEFPTGSLNKGDISYFNDSIFDFRLSIPSIKDNIIKIINEINPPKMNIEVNDDPESNDNNFSSSNTNDTSSNNENNLANNNNDAIDDETKLSDNEFYATGKIEMEFDISKSMFKKITAEVNFTNNFNEVVSEVCTKVNITLIE